ncbi:methyltransferase, FkbM family [Methylobacterium sp. 174MFSha1.1]|uniref:FkbM family methyltransferase n=1 Tax=Methylobacterium sp. 174MFSha1.1 TaxID=1502749 RepID=UPI0008DEE6D3|nr:FkbM family methyltransferase [Methylobacterium sp. 174MFSha1.1]SFU75736.1 methyltransferase, FkbM family [Methylobacterium sp. 174MFSha1.1]
MMLPQGNAPDVVQHPDLIFDLGANHGEDTAFYLAKGFRVVAVEADPHLARELEQVFRQPIAAGRCTIVAAGLLDRPGVMPFYRNIDCDHWSSFDAAYGTRDGTRFETLPISCGTVLDLFAQYGLPHYMKIDLEGADQIVLRTLQRTASRPRFLSVEEFGHGSLPLLRSLGYTRFSLRPQKDKSWAVPPRPPREGRFVDRTSTGRDSGLFGREVGGWKSYDVSLQDYERVVRSAEGAWLPQPGEWYDIHAAIWPSRLDDDPL